MKEKEDNLQEFETLVKNFRFKYEKGSEFSQQLQVTYNEDLKVLLIFTVSFNGCALFRQIMTILIGYQTHI